MSLFFDPYQRVGLNGIQSALVLDPVQDTPGALIRIGITNSFYIDQNSRVGIGTTSPGRRLEVADSAGSCLRLRYGATNFIADMSLSAIGDLTIDPTGEIATNKNLNIKSHNGTTTGLLLNGTLVRSTAAQLNLLAGVTAGTAVASSVLAVDTNRDITNIRNLTASQLTGTLQTGSQPNITSLGTLSALNVESLTVSGSLSIPGSANIDVPLGYVSGITPGTAIASKALVLDLNREISNILGVSTAVITIGGTSINGTQAGYLNGAAVGTVVSNKAIVAGPTGSIGGVDSLSCNSLTIASSTINGTIASYLVNSVTGAVAANKVVIASSQRSITNLTSVESTEFYGSLMTASQPNITSLGTLTSVTSGTYTSSGATSRDVFSSSAGTGTFTITNNTSGAIMLNASASFNFVTNGATRFQIANDGSIMITSNVDAIDDLSAALFVKSIIVGSKLRVTSSITCAGGFYGSVMSPTQSQITSLGTLTGLTSSGTIVSSAAVTQDTFRSETYVGGTVLSAFSVYHSKITGIATIGTTTEHDLWIRANNTPIIKITASTLRASFEQNLDAVSSTNASVTFAGGVGIARSLYVGTNLTVGGSITGSIGGTQTGITQVGTLTSLSTSGLIGVSLSATGSSFRSTNGSTTMDLVHTVNAGVSFTTTNSFDFTTNSVSRMTINNSGVITLKSTTNATSATVAGTLVSGGLGVNNDLYVGGTINGTLGTTALASITSLGTLNGLTTSNTIDSTKSGIGYRSTASGYTFEINHSATQVTLRTSAAFGLNLGTGATDRLSISSAGVIACSNTTEATNLTGAFTLAGGLYTAKKIYAVGDVTTAGSFFGALSAATQQGITQLGTVASTINVNAATAIATSNAASYNALTATSGTNVFEINHALNAATTLRTTGATSLVLGTSNLDRITISSTGVITIDSTFTLNGTESGSSSVAWTPYTKSCGSTTVSTFQIAQTTTGITRLQTSTNTSLVLGTNGTDRIVIAGGGSIDFKNSSMTGSSTISWNPFARTCGTNVFTMYQGFNGDTQLFTSGSTSNFELGAGGNIRLRINAAGTVDSLVPFTATRMSVTLATDGGSTTEGSSNSFQIRSTTDNSKATLYMGASSLDDNTWISSSKTGSMRPLVLQPRGGQTIIGALATGAGETCVINGTTKITGLLTASGGIEVTGVTYPLKTINGTSTFHVNHINNGTVVAGTTTLHNFQLMTNGSSRLVIAADGNVSVMNNLSVSGRMNISGTLRGTSMIDLGTGHSSAQLIIQQTSSTTGSNMIGSSSTEFTMTSAASSGFAFYSNTTTGASAPEMLGNKVATIDQLGNVRSTAQLYSSGGIHARSFANDATLQAFGPGAHMHYASNIASFFGYDYEPTSSSPWRDVSIGNNTIYVKDSAVLNNNMVGFGTTNPTYPVHVVKTVISSHSGYGWLNNGNYGTSAVTGYSSSSGNVAISLWATGRVVATEFNAMSDRRIKENIVDIKLDHAYRFLKEVTPRRYNIKGSTQIDYGYIAQEILELPGHALDDLVTAHVDETMEGDDNPASLEPAGFKFTVNYNEVIPLLHRTINDLLTRIEVLESKLQH